MPAGWVPTGRRTVSPIPSGMCGPSSPCGAVLAKKARGFCIFLGALLLAVGLLRFVPGFDDLLVRILNVNEAVAFFNIATGTVSLTLGLLPGHSRQTATWCSPGLGSRERPGQRPL